MMQRYKEALFDCEQALICNPSFVKAHQRAYKCYLSLGELEVSDFLTNMISQKASQSLLAAKALGDAAA